MQEIINHFVLIIKGQKLLMNTSSRGIFVAFSLFSTSQRNGEFQLQTDYGSKLERGTRHMLYPYCCQYTFLCLEGCSSAHGNDT